MNIVFLWIKLNIYLLQHNWQLYSESYINKVQFDSSRQSLMIMSAVGRYNNLSSFSQFLCKGLIFLFINY